MASLDFEQLVEIFYMPLYRFALSLSREPCDAADLTQQTFLLWASKGHQLREESKVKPWLFTTLYREFLRGQRKRRQQLESGSETGLPDVHCLPVAANNLDGDAVVRVLLDLEEIYRAPLSLFYLQEHSYREIADILDLPVGTVMSRMTNTKPLGTGKSHDERGSKTNLGRVPSGRSGPARLQFCGSLAGDATGRRAGALVC